MNKTLSLDTPKLFIVRRISTARDVSNQELATNGLAIGNNLDNTDSSVFHWKREEDGTKSRQYKIPQGKWPVYLAKSEEELSERFLKEQPDGSVVYIAEIDLEKHKLGTNVPFEYQYSWEAEIKKPETTLSIATGENGEFYLSADTPKTELQPGLASRFDNDGRLTINDSFGGEFYLDEYRTPEDLENERIFRFESGKPKEITEEIRMLREDQELTREFRGSIGRLK